VSKVDGGQWALLHLGPRDQPLVAAALALQTGTGLDADLDPDVVRAFMATARDVIRDKA
jgi:hypothetical protein